MFRGSSGSGKTTLLNACLEDLPPSVRHVPIQLRGNAVSVAEVFYRSGDRLEWDCLPNFTEQVATLSSAPDVQLNRNWLTGINNQISIALHAENPTDREERRAALTHAWFRDIHEFDRLLLMSLDTYEQATTDVKDWISGPFLARATRCKQMRVLLAGREIPDPHNIEWGECCASHDLYGVPEAEYWLPVVHALGRRIPVEPALTWLAGVCHARCGRPDEIMTIIKSLPRQETAV